MIWLSKIFGMTYNLKRKAYVRTDRTQMKLRALPFMYESQMASCTSRATTTQMISSSHKIPRIYVLAAA